MKTAVLAVTVLTLATASLVPSYAGDREWATAGKVLTGVAAVGILAEAFRPHYHETVVCQSSPPSVVYVPAPTQVVYYPAPVTQVYLAPPSPVCVVRAPIYYPQHSHRSHFHYGVGR
jgi:hypothetical protein